MRQELQVATASRGERATATYWRLFERRCHGERYDAGAEDKAESREKVPRALGHPSTMP